MSANFFINPPKSEAGGDDSDNPVYTLNPNLNISWQAPSLGPPFDLLLIQDVANASYFNYERIVGGWNESSLSIEVTTGGLDPNGSGFGPVFYFALYQPGSGTNRILSHYFNITSASASASASPSTTQALPSSSVISIPSSGVSNMLASTSSAPASTSTTSSSQLDGDAATGLSTGAKAGVGVATAIAGILIIGLALWALHLYRKLKQKNQTAISNSAIGPAANGPNQRKLYEASAPLATEIGSGLSHELNGKTGRSELG